MRIIRAYIQFSRGTLVAAIAAAAVTLMSYAVAQGVEVTNTATISYETNGAQVDLLAGPALFTIEAVRTPSEVTFYRSAPSAPDAIAIQIHGADYHTSSGFSPLDPPATTSGQALDISAPLSLVPTENFFSGETIFVGVEDLGQNMDPEAIDTVTTTVKSESGDQIILRLYETGPDTGKFFAYVQSIQGLVDTEDKSLAVARSFGVTAIYIDQFDQTEISTDAANVDPFGKVFDSDTGEFVDNVEVTIIDLTTGQPAEIFGLDGVSAYPSTVRTGSVVTDASGFTYALEPGEFIFPIMLPGQYAFVVTPPGAYNAPSTMPENILQGLENAPFTLGPASFGEPFGLSETGNVSFDIPLDPKTDIVVQKEASVPSAAPGDFVKYSISVENRAQLPIRNTLRDVLPAGFRYQQGSARLNGNRVDDPLIKSGRELNFDFGLLQAGQIHTISYVTALTGGVRDGSAVNKAFVVNRADRLISNTGEAAIEIRDDFLQNQLTIVGRVAEQACDPLTPRALKAKYGTGVAGVRLYLETGAYTLTDENGLFHFENVEVKTHVVQIDEATLPEGFEAIQCEDNTRYAGSAISKFVDGQGGSVWRANFYLQKKPQAQPQPETIPVEEKPFNQATDYLNFNTAWLDKQPRESKWAYPAMNATPTLKSINLGLAHPNGLKVALFVNGQKAKPLYFAGRDLSSDKKLALTRWRGVHLLDGENTIKAVISDMIGNEVKILERTINFVTSVQRAEYIEEGSILVANGLASPRIAVRFTDGAGRPVHRGRVIEFTVAPPYRSKTQSQLEDELLLTAGNSAKATATIDKNGIAFLELAPTVEAGKVRLGVLLDDGKQARVVVKLVPELREWIVNGLVEGSLSDVGKNAANTPMGKGRELLRAGRAAIFAKGTVAKDWLITAAIDTDKRRGAEDDELFDAIDPDDRFPLYGDRSDQQFEAQSRYPIFLKAENGGLRGLIGDYDSDLNDSKLGRYTRRFTGAQAIYEGEKFAFSGFAADTNQSFIKDEIAADGTSGPYRLTTAPLVRNSETVIIETRDRFRPDVVVATKPMVRYLDYDIDFLTGDLIFRLPVPATDDRINNNIIVIDYETSEAVDRNIIAGGRAAVRVLGGRGEIGGSVIHESAIPGTQTGSSSLAGVDVVVNVTDDTDLRVEYAATRLAGTNNDKTATATLAEIQHKTERLDLNAYYNETEQGFGLAQQNSATVGVRRYGLESRLRFKEFTNEKGTVRGQRFLEAKAYREENLETGASRTLTQASIGQSGNGTSGQIGIRRVVEEPVGAAPRRSLLLTSKIAQNFEDAGLTIRASREQPLGGENSSVQFPKRTTIGFDKQLFGTTTLSGTHEVLDGTNQESSNTVIGLRASLWRGSRFNISTDRITQDSSERIGATIGVDQEVRLTKKWTGSLGVTRRENLKNRGQLGLVDDILPDAPISPQDTNSSYTSFYMGAGFRGQKSTGSLRGELRKNIDGQRYTVTGGTAREVSANFSFAGAARYTQENNLTTPDSRASDVRFGAAWRPRDAGIIAFNRFDLKTEDNASASESWKAVNNFALNAQITERLQLALQYGLKYSILETDGDKFEGITQLFGGEARFDITSNIDIGFHGSTLISHNSNTLAYAFGPSIGISPAKNTWISVGWNIRGFKDDDFEAAEYTRAGPYIKLRIKFDQHSARALLSRITP